MRSLEAVRGLWNDAKLRDGLPGNLGEPVFSIWDKNREGVPDNILLEKVQISFQRKIIQIKQLAWLKISPGGSLRKSRFSNEITLFLSIVMCLSGSLIGVCESTINQIRRFFQILPRTTFFPQQKEQLKLLEE